MLLTLLVGTNNTRQVIVEVDREISVSISIFEWRAVRSLRNIASCFIWPVLSHKPLPLFFAIRGAYLRLPPSPACDLKHCICIVTSLTVWGEGFRAVFLYRFR
ncbi:MULTISPECIES: hypothetical protein [Burkholderia]|uniref:hypothetical protein n=1 Tax=Burkholderia TaxID=32008 RepID=UPI000AAF4DBC|nr:MULTISPECIES: hypothetical protein [unclassified Burkholderia]